jgi:hypothetical protein
MGMGWQLQHHTCTHVHHTHSGYGYTPYPYVCSVVEQLQVSWNLQFFIIPMSSRGDFVAHPYLHHCAPLPSKPMGGDFSPTTTLSALQTSMSGPHSPSPPFPNEWECLHCPPSIHQLTVRGLCHTHPSALQMTMRGLTASITPPLPLLEQGWAFVTQLHVCTTTYPL